MTRPVVWSNDALNDLGDVLEYIASTDRDYALWLVDQIEAAGDRLGEMPTGHPGRMDGCFEKSLPKIRYIIAYDIDRTKAGPITILRVIHSSRDWKPGTWPE